MDWVLKNIPDLTKESISKDASVIDAMAQYVNQSAGLDELLIRDKIYIKLSRRLDKLRSVIPSRKISAAVKKYLDTSKIVNSLMLVTQPCQSNISILTQILPIRMIVDSSLIPSKTENTMTTLLAEVRESIENYYKGK